MVTAYTKNDLKNKIKGGTLVEVLIAAFFFVSTSAYILDSQIQAKLLWQTIKKNQQIHLEDMNARRATLLYESYEQRWEDIAVFGSLVPTQHQSIKHGISEIDAVNGCRYDC